MVFILIAMAVLDKLEYQYNTDTLWNTILACVVMLEIFYNSKILKLFGGS